jgi:hypothetical protein
MLGTSDCTEVLHLLPQLTVQDYGLEDGDEVQMVHVDELDDAEEPLLPEPLRFSSKYLYRQQRQGSQLLRRRDSRCYRHGHRNRERERLRSAPPAPPEPLVFERGLCCHRRCYFCCGCWLRCFR